MNTIQHNWDHYLDKVIPASASDQQVAETKLAFYAGSVSMFSMLTDILGSKSETASVAILEGLQQEIAYFLSSVEDSVG